MADPSDTNTGQGPAARRHPWTIQRRIALVYGVVSAVILAAVALYAAAQNAALAERKEAALVTEANRLADRVGGVLARGADATAMAARLGAAGLASDPASCQAVVDTAYLPLAPYLLDLAFVDAHGTIHCALRREAAGRQLEPSPLLRAAMVTGRPVVATIDAATGPAGEGPRPRRIAIGHPVEGESGPIGTLLAIVSAEELRRALPPATGFEATWLLDSTGHATRLHAERAEPPLPEGWDTQPAAIPQLVEAGAGATPGTVLIVARATPDLSLVAAVPAAALGDAAPLGIALPALLLAALLLTGLSALAWATRRFVLAPLEVATRRLEGAGPAGAGLAEGDTPAEIAGLLRRLGAARSTREEAIRLRDTLLRESHHRIKNHLALVGTFLRLQERQLSDHAALKALRAAQGRILAIGMTYELLHDGAGQEVELDHLLDRFARALAVREGADGRGTQILTDLTPLSVPADVAVRVGLVVNELATNALKYAFVDRPGGTVRIGLRRQGAGFVLRVSDDGVGFAETGGTEAGRRGLGLTVVDSLLRAIDARIERLPGPGTAFEMSWTPARPGLPHAEPDPRDHSSDHRHEAQRSPSLAPL